MVLNMEKPRLYDTWLYDTLQITSMLWISLKSNIPMKSDLVYKNLC